MGGLLFFWGGVDISPPPPPLRCRPEAVGMGGGARPRGRRAAHPPPTPPTPPSAPPPPLQNKPSPKWCRGEGGRGERKGKKCRLLGFCWGGTHTRRGERGAGWGWGWGGDTHAWGAGCGWDAGPCTHWVLLVGVVGHPRVVLTLLWVGGGIATPWDPHGDTPRSANPHPTATPGRPRQHRRAQQLSEGRWWWGDAKGAGGGGYHRRKGSPARLGVLWGVRVWGGCGLSGKSSFGVSRR